jgi:hypothetical protein
MVQRFWPVNVAVAGCAEVTWLREDANPSHQRLVKEYSFLAAHNNP